MKPVMLVALAPLALAACNSSNPFGGTTTGNASAAVPVTPDAVIVNGVTYVRAGGPVSSITPSASPTMSANTLPTVAPTSPPPPTVPEDVSTPASSSGNPDGVVVTGGH